jgi:hypothetical protein
MLTTQSPSAHKIGRILSTPPVFQRPTDQDPDDQQKHKRQPVFHSKQK